MGINRRVGSIKPSSPLTYETLPDRNNLIERLRSEGLERVEKALTWYGVRPPSKRDLDQFPADIPSLISQANFMGSSVVDRTVVIEGDHDGLSLLLASFCNPKKVIVLELDDSTINWLQEIAMENGLPVKVVKYDLRESYKKMRQQIGNEVEVVRTDPPYNCGGIWLFVLRAAQMLKLGGQLFMCLPASSSLWGHSVLYNAFYRILPALGFDSPEFSATLNTYSQVEGMASIFWRYELKHCMPLQDDDFNFDIYHPSEAFCKNFFKCCYYPQCLLNRKNWKTLRWAFFTELKLLISI